MQLHAVIKRRMKVYLLYLLGERMQKVTMSRLVSEIVDLNGNGYDRAVLLCSGKQVARDIMEKAEKFLGMREVLILPYPQGLPILNFYNSEEL